MRFKNTYLSLEDMTEEWRMSPFIRNTNPHHTLLGYFIYVLFYGSNIATYLYFRRKLHYGTFHKTRNQFIDLFIWTLSFTLFTNIVLCYQFPILLQSKQWHSCLYLQEEYAQTVLYKNYVLTSSLAGKSSLPPKYRYKSHIWAPFSR